MATNVENLKAKLTSMAEPNSKGKNNLWDVAVSINRTNDVPLDKSSIIFEEDTTIAEAAQSPTAYPGQVITSLGTLDGKSYVLQPDNHEHKTHTADDTGEIEAKDLSVSSTAAYEELAFQSNVDYQVNKEIYNRKVAINAETKARVDADATETAERKSEDTNIVAYIKKLKLDQVVSVDNTAYEGEYCLCVDLSKALYNPDDGYPLKTTNN